MRVASRYSVEIEPKTAMDRAQGILLWIIFFVVSYSMVEGQSLTANLTVNEIKRFQASTANSLTQPFNSLRDDVYGHFYRSQNTLRQSRQGLFARAQRFPYYRLTTETRKSLVKRVTEILLDIIDPTVDFLQKDSMLRYFNFMKDENSPIEKALKPMTSQLEDLIKTVQASNDSCISKESITVRRLDREYSSYVGSINSCVREAFSAYRQPIGEFTRVHFTALPFIGRIQNDLGGCEGGNNQEECINNFLKKYCSEDSCRVSSIITVVRTQAETMVNMTQDRFDECANGTQMKIPVSLTFNDNLKKCNSSKADEPVKEESEANVV